MKKLVFSVFIFSMIACSTEQFFSDVDQSVDFRNYKTFAWYAKPSLVPTNTGFDNQILESNIKNITSAQLKLRGLKVDIDSPDLVFDYQIMIENKVDHQEVPVYSYPYNYGYNNPYRPNSYYNNYNYPPQITGYKTQDIPYKEGTLIITCTDKSTNRLIWRGWSVGTVTDVQSYEAELYSDIQDIMKRFPATLRYYR